MLFLWLWSGVIYWDILVVYSLLSNKAQNVHLLWALCFMKVYPAVNVSASTADGSRRLIDSKAFLSHQWSMISAISNLAIHVVSLR